MSLFIPTELAIQIIELISNERDLPSLASLCLVSKRFAALAQPLLYRTVPPAKMMFKSLTATQMVHIHRTLAHNEDLRLSVRNAKLLPDCKQEFWFKPAMLRLVMRGISSLPTLEALHIPSYQQSIPVNFYLGLPINLKSLALDATTRVDILHIINQHPQLLKLAVMLIASDDIRQVLDSPLITPATLPNLEEIHAPNDFLIRLLPNRRIRRLYFLRHLYEGWRIPGYHERALLAGALSSGGDSIEHLLLTISRPSDLLSDLPLVLRSACRLRELTLGVFPMNARRIFEKLGSPLGTSVFSAAPCLETLGIRHTIPHSEWVEQFHDNIIHHVQCACPRLREFFSCRVEEKEGVSYIREERGIGHGWRKMQTSSLDPELIYPLTI